jgi:hypothetical protein
MRIMKNIVCPISKERIPEHLPRLNALFVISLLSLYVFNGFVPLLIFLFFDFIARGAGLAKYSLIHHLSIAVSNGFSLKSKSIDKAPKLFAARLGAVMIGVAAILALLNFQIAASVIALAVAVFATLECVLNFCVGCYFYSLFVLPVFNRQN